MIGPSITFRFYPRVSSQQVDRLVAIRTIAGLVERAQEKAYRERHLVQRFPRQVEPSLRGITAPGVFASRRMGEQTTHEVRENGAYHCVLVKTERPITIVEEAPQGLLKGWFK